MTRKLLISVLLILLAVPFVSAREYNGVDMPETLKVGPYTVVLNGVGIRKVLFIKPYVGGLYLTHAETDGNKIMAADEPMAIRLELIDDVGYGMFLRALYNGMRNSTRATGDSFEPLKERYSKLKSFFPKEEGFKEGDIYEFKYLPGSGMQVIKNGKLLGTIPGLDFKKAFFGIWLNDEYPADSNLRTAMLAGDVRVAVSQIAEKKVAEAEEAAKAAAEKEAQRLAQAKAAAEEAARKEAEKKAAALEAERIAKAEAAKRAAAEAAAKAAAEEAARKAAAEEAARKAAAEEAARKAAAQEAARKAAAQEAAKKAAMEAAAQRAKKEAAIKAKEAETKVAAAPEGLTAKQKAEFENELVFFGFDEAVLSKSAMKTLAKKAEFLKKHPGIKVKIEVYTDERGPEAYNLWLSEQRGKAIKKYLSNAGVEASRITIVPMGEKNPLDPRHTLEAWKKNRRAKFIIVE